ncbi:hypothetical protein D6C78_08365 [Aureobasidium pullulans]|uniref:Uncharacterized protein n=1 Tax=Aureobasidium pullulans TaxID=5580 RepID=A0A4T0BDH8_AURPU|nr:hypothetical protein D6C78_08365 [Aureobasidium pullulans]
MDDFAIRIHGEDASQDDQSSRNTAPTKREEKGKGKGRGQTRGKRQQKRTLTTTLRDIEISDRHFWKGEITEQLSQKVLDSRGIGTQRKLPGNELTVMGLNEIAAERGRGYFFHMLTREAWTSWPGEELYPRTRVPKPPGSRFPTLLYMNYVWTEAAR